MNYYERKAAGICARCSNPVTKGVYCDSCKAKNRALKRSEYENARSRNECVKCGKPTDGKAHCPMCLKVLRVKQKQRYAELTDEQRKKMYLKNLRYLAENPDKKALYASRRAEYQRRYMLGDE